MVRTTTQTKINARCPQWDAAWSLLTREWRAAIFDFLMNTDRDVGAAVMRAR